MPTQPMPTQPMPTKTTATKVNLLILVGATVLTLAGCAADTTPTTEKKPSASPIVSPISETTVTTAPSPMEKTAKVEHAQKGGQVVEMGDYHLELLAAPEGENVHVDFWLMTGTDHAAIADAKVIANIQFPNGTQKTVDMTYDTAGQHYKALVPGFIAGEYRVVVQTDVKGEKMNGRFNFKL